MSSKPSRWAKVKGIVSVPSLSKSVKKRKDSKDAGKADDTSITASQRDDSRRPSQEAAPPRAVPTPQPAPPTPPIPQSAPQPTAQPTPADETTDVKVVSPKDTESPSTPSVEESKLYQEAVEQVDPAPVPIPTPTPTPTPPVAPAPSTHVPKPQLEPPSSSASASTPLPPQPESIAILDANVKEAKGGEMSELISALEQNEVELRAARSDNANLNGRVGEVSQRLALVEERARGLEDDLRQRADQTKSLERNLEEEKAKARTLVEDGKAQLARAAERVHELENLRRLQSQRSDDLEQELADARKFQDGLKKRAEELELGNRQQGEKVKDLESKLKKLEGEKNVKGKEKKGLEGDLGRLRSQITTLETSLTQLRRDNENLTKAQEKSGHEKERLLSEQKQKLEAAEKDKRDIIARFEDEIAKVTREMERRIQDEREAKAKEVEESRKERTLGVQRSEAALEAAARQRAELQDRIREQETELQEAKKRIAVLETAQVDPEVQPNQPQLDQLDRQNRMLADQIRRQALQIRQQKVPPVNSRMVPTLKPRKTDVQSLATRLNGEIFQLSAHMADTIEFAGSGMLPGTMKRGVEGRASVTIGRPLVAALEGISARSTMGHDPFAVQIALQACMTRCSAKIAASWYPGHWDYSYFLETLYERIRGSDPSFAAQWRATTQSLLKPSMDDDIHRSLRMWLGSNVADVLIVSGWYEADETKAQSVCYPFTDALGRIVALALQLNALTGEEYEVAVVEPDNRFNPDAMEDAYDDMESDLAGERVLCSTGLGVVSEAGESVLRPQVVLQSTFQVETTYEAFE